MIKFKVQLVSASGLVEQEREIDKQDLLGIIIGDLVSYTMILDIVDSVSPEIRLIRYTDKD